MQANAAEISGAPTPATAPGACLPACLPSRLLQVSIVFGGLFVNASNVPAPLKWLPSASLIKQAVEGACVHEFKGGWLGG